MKKLGSILVPVLVVLAFLAAGAMHDDLRDLRQEYRLSPQDPLEDAPPLVSFITVAMGGFRGILADVLWMRISRLQQEGRYVELVQLSEWITALEPRFASVWAYHAWNLSYNVSVMFGNPEDRWRWVRHGLHLLRDKGLSYNPGSAQLYYELGWILHHKIAGHADSLHLYYKQAWSRLAASPEGAAELKIDPEARREIEAVYGPLNWGNPDTHAAYWALQGMPHATGFMNISLHRLVSQAFAQAFLHGRIAIGDDGRSWQTFPDPSFLDPALTAFEAALAAHPDEATFKTAQRNFLRRACMEMAVFEPARAEDLFRRLRQAYPEETPEDSVEALIRSVSEGFNTVPRPPLMHQHHDHDHDH